MTTPIRIPVVTEESLGTSVARVGFARAEAEDAVQARTLYSLQRFIDWLKMKPGAKGYIGEVGWPRADTSQYNDPTEGQKWAKVAEKWFQMADRAGLWVTQWASGSMFGANYKLAAYSPVNGLSPASIARPGTSEVLENHKTFERVLRGVSVSTLEWHSTTSDFTSTITGPYATLSPGVEGTDFRVEPAGTWPFLYGRGVRLVRIPFRWERMQPTLGGALDATYLGYLKSMVTAARNAGLRVIIDCHNYGGFFTPDKVRQPLCTPDSYVQSLATAQQFANLWVRLSAEFPDRKGVFFGLMNEPALMPRTPGIFNVITSIGDFEDGTTQSWGPGAVNSTDRAKGGTKSLKITLPGSVNYGSLLRSTPGVMIPGSASVFGGWVFPPANTSINAYLSFKMAGGVATTYGSPSFTSLVGGAWNLIQSEVPEQLRGREVQNATLGFSGLPTGAPLDVYADMIGFGSGTFGGTEAFTWEQVSQHVVHELRAINDTRLIAVSVYDIANAERARDNHPRGPWIFDYNRPSGIGTLDDAIIYEAHHYFDSPQSGSYVNTYAQELAFATQGGFAPGF